jgi:hypothetical protein
MLKEVSRVLSDDGVYICITYGEEELRLPILDKVIILLVLF